MVKEEKRKKGKRTDIQEALREKMAEGMDPTDALNALEEDEGIDKEALAKWVDNFNSYRRNKKR